MRASRIRNVVVAVLAGALTVAAAPASAQAVVGDGYTGITNLNSSLALEPIGGSTANGAAIIQSNLPSIGNDFSSSQNWTFVSSGGYIIIKNKSGKVLGVDGASTAAGAKIILATSDSSTNQQWLNLAVASYPSGYVALKNRKSSLCIGISGASTAAGAQAMQFPCDASRNQAWARRDL